MRDLLRRTRFFWIPLLIVLLLAGALLVATGGLGDALQLGYTAF